MAKELRPASTLETVTRTVGAVLLVVWLVLIVIGADQVWRSGIGFAALGFTYYAGGRMGERYRR